MGQRTSDTRPTSVHAQFTPIYRLSVSGHLGEYTCVLTPSNIGVVNSGNAPPKAQRNTVLTEKADAVYILERG